MTPPGLILVSGGQTGVDRAALLVARRRGVPYRGWCPKGGWAEDLTEPPGLLAVFPLLTPTPAADPAQRTEWNVRDSDGTVVITLADARSPGTDTARACAVCHGRPVLAVDVASGPPRALAEWVWAFGRPVAITIAGPRESERPGIQAQALAWLDQACQLLEAGPA